MEINPIAIKCKDWVVLGVKMDFQCNGTACDAHISAVEPYPVDCGHNTFRRTNLGLGLGISRSDRTRTRVHRKTGAFWLHDENVFFLQQGAGERGGCVLSTH